MCEIIYVKEASETGWKWRVILGAEVGRASERTYPLFYDCVTAARARGLEINFNCL